MIMSVHGELIEVSVPAEAISNALKKQKAPKNT